jgi:hypothetical protein
LFIFGGKNKIVMIVFLSADMGGLNSISEKKTFFFGDFEIQTAHISREKNNPNNIIASVHLKRATVLSWAGVLIGCYAIAKYRGETCRFFSLSAFFSGDATRT